MNHNNNNVVLANLFNLYLSDSDMSFLLPGPVSGGGEDCFHYIYTGAASFDLLNFSGNISLECLRFGTDWLNTLRNVRLKSLIILMGAGGAVLYFMRRSRPPASNVGAGSEPWNETRWPGQGLFEWLFSEELVEDPSLYDSYSLHSYYFGPDLAQLRDIDHRGQASSNDAEDEDSDDVSLNSLSNKSSPVKFLKKPLFDLSYDGSTARFRNVRTPLHEQEYDSPSPVQISHPCPNCVKGSCRLKRHQFPPGSSASSSCYSGSPIFRIKTSTPDQPEDDQILQRTVAYNRLTFRHYLPGQDIRMRGDGCEEDSSISLGISRDTSVSSLADFSQMSASNSMMDIVKDARQVRRWIRQVSLDSQDSDLDIDLELRENSRAADLEQFCEEMNKMIDNCDDVTDDKDHKERVDPGEECNSSIKDSSDRNISRENSIPDFKLIQRKTCINRRLWKLTGFSEHESLNFSETSDNDNVSMEWDSPIHNWSSPSMSLKNDQWEWDNEFSNDAIVDDDISHEPSDEKAIDWLKNLDSSSVMFSSRSTSRRSSTDTEASRGLDIRYMTRYPPSGRSSVDRESVISRLSEEELSTSHPTPTSSRQKLFTTGITRSKSGSFRSGSESPITTDLQSSSSWDLESPSSGNFVNMMNTSHTSATSLESGFQDGESSMTSSVSSSIMNTSITSYPPVNMSNSSFLTSYPQVPLSPVKECKEPRSPAKQPPCSASEKT